MAAMIETMLRAAPGEGGAQFVLRDKAKTLSVSLLADRQIMSTVSLLLILMSVICI